MRISHKHKLIFFATPRTGSTTARQVLDQFSDIKSVDIADISDSFPFYHHISPIELEEIFKKEGWDWQAYRKFCVVRNPYDRAVSLYYLKKRILAEKVKGKGLIYNFLRDMKYKIKPIRNFKDFVFQVDSKARLEISIEHFIKDKSGEDVIKDILVFENLSVELPKYLEKFDIQISAEDIPHLNASKRRRDFREYYDEETKERVFKLYEYEFKRFGYEFD